MGSHWGQCCAGAVEVTADPEGDPHFQAYARPEAVSAIPGATLWGHMHERLGMLLYQNEARKHFCPRQRPEHQRLCRYTGRTSNLRGRAVLLRQASSKVPHGETYPLHVHPASKPCRSMLHWPCTSACLCNSREAYGDQAMLQSSAFLFAAT